MHRLPRILVHLLILAVSIAVSFSISRAVDALADQATPSVIQMDPLVVVVSR